MHMNMKARTQPRLFFRDRVPRGVLGFADQTVPTPVLGLQVCTTILSCFTLPWVMNFELLFSFLYGKHFY